MSKRGLNIYRRKDGRYEGRYADGYGKDGKKKYRSIYGRTYTEVKDKLLQIKARVITPDRESGLTVKELFTEWLSAKQTQTKASTYANYAFKAEKHLIPAFGSLKIEKLSPSKVYEFIMGKRTKGLSNKYISDLIIVLKNMTRYASKVHHCVNPIADVELPKKEKHELDLYNKSEQNRLKSVLLTDMDITKLVIMLALFTGVRIGELCGLKWTDIDFATKTLHIERTIQRIRVRGKANRTELVVSTPKSQSSVRTIPIPEFLVRMLKAFKPSNVDAFIITGNCKLPDPRTIQYRFKALLARIGLRPLNFHSLRHLFATNCVELGFDIKTLSEILGHSSVEITLNRYVHSSIERKRQCMDMLSLDVA
ncbi:tyrosine-type recombinase/integrase [Ruminococcus flavefaciens]|uniref:Site-specific recombinase XerD n=1 Tax=Ruminococcus flavefaciens TaxID=1265 RepID=A0A1M7HT23_RUMFL|nr:site-specific integrase [Ruminococcus flavefaciens]SHM31692.1 Site-specific recombinase XerD [Ruminococcus flavefaciens]